MSIYGEPKKDTASKRRLEYDQPTDCQNICHYAQGIPNYYTVVAFSDTETQKYCINISFLLKFDFLSLASSTVRELLLINQP